MPDPDRQPPEPPTPPKPVSFPRGGAGPPQPLPKGAHVGLVLVSLLMLATVFGILGWLFL